MSPAERLKVLLFLALFFGALGFLFTLLSCGTEYWLLAAESCSEPEERHGGSDLREGRSSTEAAGGVRVFHEGLFWRCSFTAVSSEQSVWDLWISTQPPSEVCEAAFLFPFPVYQSHGFPTESYQHQSAIVFRTFWSIFLVTGVAAAVIGGFVVICAAPLTNHRLYRLGGSLLLCGGLCLLTVVLMYLMWVHVLDTLEQFANHRRASTCSSFQLSVQHGPSFLFAPVCVFFLLLAGLLFLLVSRSVQQIQLQKRDRTPDPPASDGYV